MTAPIVPVGIEEALRRFPELAELVTVREAGWFFRGIVNEHAELEGIVGSYNRAQYIDALWTYDRTKVIGVRVLDESYGGGTVWVKESGDLQGVVRELLALPETGTPAGTASGHRLHRAVDPVMLRVNLSEAGERLVVFGYLRLGRANVEEYGARRTELETYAAGHGLRVGRVFVDEGPSDEVVSHSGFTQLCMLLRLEQSHGVLLLQSEDLSPHEASALMLARRIWAAGVDICTVHGEAPFTERQPSS